MTIYKRYPFSNINLKSVCGEHVALHKCIECTAAKAGANKLMS